MGASAISDALVTMLSAASVFGDGMVTKDDYGVLERASGSCAVVEWVGLGGEPTAIGGEFDDLYTHEIAAFAKDLDDPKATLRRVLSVIDGVVSCIRADQSLQGTAGGKVQEIRANREPRVSLEAGGQRWLPIFIEVDSLIWP